MRVPGATGAGQPPRAGSIEEFRAGLRCFPGNRVLVTLALGAVIATLGTGAINPLLVFFVPATLH